MPVKFGKDENSSDRWLIADAKGKPELGAYMPASEADLTVYWCGQFSTGAISAIIDDAEKTLAEKNGGVKGTLTAYGQSRERIGPTHGLSSYLAKNFSKGFDAYRAEIEGRGERLVIWANVAIKSFEEFKDGEENIGICATPALFDGAGRPIVERAIEKTTKLDANTVSQLLYEISDAMLLKTQRSST